ncbi:MAG TPA: methionine adenosyltransferase [Nitrospiraceae bacterium]|nr:methionine adenosyltransferase [Nitrospiraceae bacterium]
MIEVELYRGTPVSDNKVEIVERKGLGHPDYMCDSIMESISVALSKEYLKEVGTILHYNIDKGLLVAGQVQRSFGGGRVIKPMELIIGDRATFEANGKKIKVEDIAVETSKIWLRKNLRFVNPENDVRFRVVLAPGSTELTDIFMRAGEIRVANDTSAAIGYYPLTPTERAVLSLEGYLNSKEFKFLYPETGEDVKIMGMRDGRNLDVTVAMPMLADHIHSEADYFDKKESLHKIMVSHLEDGFKDFFNKIEVHFNTLDKQGRGLGGIYLSVLGTSAEDADSGQVGRGNRVNGLISMNRPMGTEAAAGKNPVSHVGKIYNIFSHKVARDIYKRVEGLKEVYVLLLSRIGTPINEPQVASLQLSLEEGADLNEITRKSREIMEEELSRIGDFCFELAMGKYPVC